MSPVKRRRRLPTLINRGLGLLEVILPCGTLEGGESFLPPGQRDTSGFWFPVGYDKPGDIFSPLQRRMQEHQRQIQRRRVSRSARTLPPPAGGDDALTARDLSAASHSPPDADGRMAALPPEIPLPLPPALSETDLQRHARDPRGTAAPAPYPAPPRRAGGRTGSAETPILPEPDRIAAPARAAVVDSREGSD